MEVHCYSHTTVIHTPPLELDMKACMRIMCHHAHCKHADAKIQEPHRGALQTDHAKCKAVASLQPKMTLKQHIWTLCTLLSLLLFSFSPVACHVLHSR